MTLVALVVATILVGFLLRRYWWGMVWAVAPDIIDWLILRPTLGRGVIHEWLSWISTPWGFALEMAFVALIVVVLLKRQGKMAKESLNNS
jgi:hypothetical protein